MGARGRPPKPVALRLIEGNPGKRAIKDDALKIGGPPLPTRSMGKEARVIWDRLVKFMPLGVWNCCDSDLLVAYCNLVVLHDRVATEFMASPSLTVANRNGEPVMNPLIKAQLETASRMATLGARLGLDPLARQSIRAPVESPRPNRFSHLSDVAKDEHDG